MKTKTFCLGDVLSITTGRLVSPRHIQGVYDILNFMTGDNLFTHQLPRAMEECAPFLLKQFPELEQAGSVKSIARLDELLSDAKHRKEPPENAITMWLKWMAEPGTCNLKEKYKVAQIPPEAHQIKSPIAELAEKINPKKVVVVNLGSGAGKTN